MAKYAGLVGYVTQTETKPGVWGSVEEEVKMRGDVIRLSSAVEQNTKVNDNIDIRNRISLVANQYAYANFSNLKYIWYLGQKWKVTSVEVQRPRLICELGGLYNG